VKDIEKFRNIFWEKKFQIFIVIFVIFSLYAKAVNYPVVHDDDQAMVINSYETNRKFANILKPFFVPATSSIYYRPLVESSFVIDAQFGGTDTTAYHITNILFHITSVLLIYYLLVRLGYSQKSSFVACLFFSIHPLLTQGVAWISGRYDSLVTIFSLTSFHLFLSYLHKKKLSYLIGHYIFFIFALFSKEAALFIPLFSLYYLRFISKSIKIQKLSVNLILGWLNMVLIWFFIRQSVLSKIPFWVDHSQIDLGFVVYTVVRNFSVVPIMLGKVFFPQNLSVVMTIKDSSILPGVIVLFVFLGLLYLVKSKRWSYIVFGSMWFLFPLILTLIAQNPDAPSAANPNSQASYFFEHRIYFSLVGVLIIILEFTKKITINKIVSLLLIIYMTFLAGVTYHHIGNFSNKRMFWRNVAESSPSFWEIAKSHVLPLQ